MKPEGNKKLTRREYREENIDGSKIKLNFWNIWADRPYVTVTIIVLAVLCIMTGYWLGLVALIIITAIGVITIGHSHHPNRVLSIGFYLKSSRLLSALKAMQLGASIIMFLATYMRRVVSVDFSAAGTQDSLQIIQGLLSNTGRYGQQGSYFIGLLNTLTGGSLLGSYRYATNTSQMMSDSAGLMIISWILLLMIAPAICVLSEFLENHIQEILA